MTGAPVAVAEDAVARHYDELDTFYREIWGDDLHHGLWERGDETLGEARRQLTEFVAAKALVGLGVRVCDIGCGYGVTSRRFAELGARVTAITISSAQYEVAAGETAPADNPTFVLGDWLTCELPAGSFDAAVAIECVEQLPDQPAFFRRAARVLKPGGRLVVTGWLARENPSEGERCWWLDPAAKGARMNRFQTASTYDRWAAEAGFRVESFEDLSAQTAPTWPAIVREFLAYLIRHPARWRLLLDPRCHAGQFGIAIVRLIGAFRLGILRYGAFTFVRAGA